MALHWNLEKVENFKERCFITAQEDLPGRGVKKGEDFMCATTEGLVFATMSVGLGRITEKNWQKFYARVSFIERLSGAMRTDDKGKPVFFKPQDVRDHIGLSCNVGDEADTKWLSRIYRTHRQRHEAECRKLDKK